MMKTSNTYNDCMKMPLAVLLATIKHIRISNLMQNDEWREAYLKLQAEENIKKNKVLAQKKMDVSGLKSFAVKV